MIFVASFLGCLRYVIKSSIMKRFRNIIHQIFNMKKGERIVPIDDSLFIDELAYKERYQPFLPGGKVVITVFLN